MSVPQISSPILVGEIYQVQEDSKDYPKYVVSVDLPNGNRTVISNVISSTMFGGVFDTFQVVRRPTLDDNGNAKPFKPGFTKGDRVLVALISNDYRRGVIIAGMQNPRNQYTLPVKDLKKPQAQLSYLGMTFSVDPEGQFVIKHEGAQKVTNTEESPKQDPKVLSKYSMLKDGTLKAEDNKKQFVEINATTKIITLKSLEEFVTIDQVKKDITLSSTKTVNILAKEKFTLKSATEMIEVDGVGHTIKLKANKTIDLKASTDVKLSGDASVILDGGKAKLSLQKGKVALGSGSVELLDLLIKLADAMTKAASTFVATKQGPGILNPSVAKAAGELKAKLSSIKGSL